MCGSAAFLGLPGLLIAGAEALSEAVRPSMLRLGLRTAWPGILAVGLTVAALHSPITLWDAVSGFVAEYVKPVAQNELESAGSDIRATAAPTCS